MHDKKLSFPVLSRLILRTRQQKLLAFGSLIEVYTDSGALCISSITSGNSNAASHYQDGNGDPRLIQ